MARFVVWVLTPIAVLTLTATTPTAAEAGFKLKHLDPTRKGPIAKAKDKAKEKLGDAESSLRHGARRTERDARHERDRVVVRSTEALKEAGYFVDRQQRDYRETLETSGSYLRDGDLYAAWKTYTFEPYRNTEDNAFRAAVGSSYLRAAGQIAASVYGGPGGGAAYSSWLAYRTTGDLEMAGRSFAISLATSQLSAGLGDTLQAAGASTAQSAMAQGVLGGASSVAQGGEFLPGFAAAGVQEAAQARIPHFEGFAAETARDAGISGLAALAAGEDAVAAFRMGAVYSAVSRCLISGCPSESASVGTASDAVAEESGALRPVNLGGADEPGDPLGRGWFVTSYPAAYDKAAHPEGVPYRTLYRSPHEQVLNGLGYRFSHPTARAWERQPWSGDLAGGLFASPRNTYVGRYAENAYGKGARRVHAGMDFLTDPGEPVISTMSGVVSVGSYSGMPSVTIRGPERVLEGKVLYLQDLQVRTGTRVVGGETVLGRAAYMRPAYNMTVPNHIHVQFTDAAGRYINPYSNEEREPAPQLEPQRTR